MAEAVDKPYVDFLHISVDYICIRFKIRLDMWVCENHLWLRLWMNPMWILCTSQLIISASWELILISIKSGFIGTGESSG